MDENMMVAEDTELESDALSEVDEVASEDPDTGTSEDSDLNAEEEEVQPESCEESTECESVEACEESTVASKEQLVEEIKKLKEQIASAERERDRMLEEIGEFSSVFPSVGLDSVPSNVWESVKCGTPLAAAYALYEKKATIQREIADAVNKKNADKSSGAISKSSDEQFYSPDEVKKMSSAEVKAKYNIIIESMKRWN